MRRQNCASSKSGCRPSNRTAFLTFTVVELKEGRGAGEGERRKKVNGQTEITHFVPTPNSIDSRTISSRVQGSLTPKGALQFKEI